MAKSCQYQKKRENCEHDGKLVKRSSHSNSRFEGMWQLSLTHPNILCALIFLMVVLTGAAMVFVAELVISVFGIE
jgi:hypothetical protein